MYRSSGQDSNKPTEEQSSVIAAKRQTADLSTDGRITVIFFFNFQFMYLPWQQTYIIN